MWHAIGQSDKKRCQLVNMQWFPWAKKMHIKRWWKGKNWFSFFAFLWFFFLLHFVAFVCDIVCYIHGRISEKFYFIGRFYQQIERFFPFCFISMKIWKLGTASKCFVFFMFWLKVQCKWLQNTLFYLLRVGFLSFTFFFFGSWFDLWSEFGLILRLDFSQFRNFFLRICI